MSPGYGVLHSMIVSRYIVRPLFFVAALCLSGSAEYAQAQDVHISQRDRDEIRAVIRAATREPILRITAVYDDHPVAGSIPRKAWRDDGRNGKVKLTPIVQYERTDKVSVQTGSDANLTGGSYVVQRLDGRWKIVGKKGFWIH